MDETNTDTAGAVDATGITEETFDLLEFVQHGTSARREVDIWTDHEAAAECQRISALIEQAEAGGDNDADTDGPLGAVSDTTAKVAALEAEAAPWLKRMQTSKMTWTVRALSKDEIDETFEQVPPPKMPIPPKDNAPRPVQEAFTDRVVNYNKAKGKADSERRLLLISTAVVSVVTARGVLEDVTVETLRELRSLPHGQGWIDRLYQAVDEASSEEVEPPVPTSPGRSTSSRD